MAGRWTVACAIALAAGGLALAARSVHLLRPVELSTVDLRFAVRGSRPAPRNIAIVALDQRTLRALGRRPPLPRSFHARVIDRLRVDGARLIAEDVQFVGRSAPREDAALLTAVARARPVLLGTHDAPGGSLPVAGRVSAPRLGARLGSVAVQNDRDGEVRRMLHTPVGIESFDVAAAEMMSRRRVGYRNFAHNSAWIDYRGPPGTFKTYSLADVARGAVPPSAFAGRVVIVGATDPLEKDVFPTPASDREMSGAEVHANAIATILAGFPLRPAGAAVDIALVLLLPLVLVPAGLRASVGLALGAAALALVALAVGSQVAFDAGRIVSVTYPALAVVLAATATSALAFAGERRARRHVRDVLGRFVPEQVANELVERGEEPRLGGSRGEVTVMFTDLRSFTTFAETTPPERVVDVVNAYLAEMSEAIFANGGTLVSSSGDGIMAVFGAPVASDDHADRAVATAREIVTRRLPRLNSWIRKRELGDGFKMGVGLNSGVAVCGNVGSERRIEYTVIGDVANVAARLESMTKDGATPVYISDATRAQLLRERERLVLVGDLPVRGRRAMIRVWTFRSEEPSA